MCWQRWIVFFVIALGLGLVWGCRADEEMSGDGGATDGDADSDMDGDVDGDSDADTDADIHGGTDVCVTLDVAIEARPAKMMILQDLSSSMNDNNKWGQAQNALTNLLTRYESKIAFGFDVFPSGGQCVVSDPLKLDCAFDAADEIISAFPAGTTRSTPLHLALSQFLTPSYAPVFSEPGMDRFLLLVSDGGDSCGTVTGNGDATAQELAAVTASLLADQSIQTIVIGFGLGTGAYEDGPSLNAIAKAGGVLDEYIEVQDESELTAAFSDIGASVVGCVYDIGEINEEEANLDFVNVYFDGEALPRDDGCAQNIGWTWDTGERKAIRFCESACEQLNSGDVSDISVEIMCSGDDVISVVV